MTTPIFVTYNDLFNLL